MKHLNIKIYGRVQGVGFRVSAKSKAKELGIFGFVRNEPDGSVYIEAEGEEKHLEMFLDYCREGPPLANVEKVNYDYSSMIKSFSNFSLG